MAHDELGSGLAVHFRLRTSSKDQDFPAILTNKDWSSGEVKDYTSRSDLGLSRDSGKLVGWTIALAPNGSWTWNLGDGNRRFDYRPTFERQPIADGAWHHLGFLIDPIAKEARLYHDGREVAIYSIAGIQQWRSSAVVDPGHGFEISELVVANEVLSPKVFADAWKGGGVVALEGPAPEPVQGLSVLTWNIWHGGRHDGDVIGIEKVAAAIRESGADVVTMQETYGSGAQIADMLGWHFYLRSSNLSVMSRYPIRATHDLYQPFRLGGVTIEISPGNFVRLFSLWINSVPDLPTTNIAAKTVEEIVAADNKTRGSEIRDILKSLMPLMAESDSVPLIVAGDFNAPSHLDWTEAMKDNHGGLVVPWPVSLQMDAAGFTDAFRTANPDVVHDVGRTWSPRLDSPELGKYGFQDRIDFIYLHGARVKVTDSRMIDHLEPGWPSDHAAVFARLTLKD